MWVRDLAIDVLDLGPVSSIVEEMGSDVPLRVAFLDDVLFRRCRLNFNHKCSYGLLS